MTGGRAVRRQHGHTRAAARAWGRTSQGAFSKLYLLSRGGAILRLPYLDHARCFVPTPLFSCAIASSPALLTTAWLHRSFPDNASATHLPAFPIFNTPL